MLVPALSCATALLIASCELLRPVRKMYLFHLSPVIESATAGSTSSTFLYSSATGSSAAGRVFQAQHQAGLSLLAVSLERAGLAVDVGDLDLAFGLGRGEHRRSDQRERAQGGDGVAARNRAS
jgi:hypothetical protein